VTAPTNFCKILLGITGGIAAYKAPELVRRLRDRGFEVRCVLTPAARSFVSPLALEIVSGHSVYGEEYLDANGSGEELHITAAAWADLVLVAPATAQTLAAMALGLADNFLLTTLLAFRGPVLVAPAMHSAMWEQDAVRSRVRELQGRGVGVLGPVTGALASGEIGTGRMLDVPEIVRAVEDRAAPARDLAGVAVLVTAGPTFEAIDPVRFLGNRSSGKMGFALAAEAAARGAKVHLVAGPVSLPTPAGVSRTDVETALEMEAAVRRLAPSADLVVMAAAVADFRPRERAAEKIKKLAGPPEIELVANPDILSLLPQLAPRALRVGFAAETAELEREAQRKLESKGAHLLVGNDVSRPDIGFASDDNEVILFRRDRAPEVLPKMSKAALARELVSRFADALRSLRGDALTPAG